MSSSQQNPEPADADIRPPGGDAQDFTLLVGLKSRLLLAASGAASVVKLVGRSVITYQLWTYLLVISLLGLVDS
jgi:hypothetical protein